MNNSILRWFSSKPGFAGALMITLMLLGSCSLPQENLCNQASACNCDNLQHTLQDEREKRLALEKHLSSRQTEAESDQDDINEQAGKVTHLENELVRLREENNTLRNQLTQLKNIEENINQREPSAILPLQEPPIEDNSDG